MIKILPKNTFGKDFNSFNCNANDTETYKMKNYHIYLRQVFKCTFIRTFTGFLNAICLCNYLRIKKLLFVSFFLCVQLRLGLMKLCHFKSLNAMQQKNRHRHIAQTFSAAANNQDVLMETKEI